VVVRGRGERQIIYRSWVEVHEVGLEMI
jgi:hypothetical protein